MAANAERGEVEIEIGGKVRLLRMGFNELAELDKALGYQSAMAMMNEGRFGAAAVRAALCVGMKGRIPALTEDIVGRWVEADIGRMREYTLAIVRAMKLSMPTQKQLADESQDTQAAKDLLVDEDGDPLEATPGPTPTAAASPMREPVVVEAAPRTWSTQDPIITPPPPKQTYG